MRDPQPTPRRENDTRTVWRLPDGRRHRDDGPAVIDDDGREEWWRDGQLHRDGAPAVTYPDGSCDYYQHDELHRDDGPAEVLSTGTLIWYWHGEPHCVEGPAMTRPGFLPSWWLHGTRVTEHTVTVTRTVAARTGVDVHRVARLAAAMHRRCAPDALEQTLCAALTDPHPEEER